MLKVFFTVDVEIWCDGWKHIDTNFPQAFQKYVYGRTPKGDYGLPFTLKLLCDHGLLGVFFVEPLFSTRFGHSPLTEIVGLVRDASQEVQLHLHTEWVDESIKPLLDNIGGKRQYLHYFSQDEQTKLIAAGKHLLTQAGSGEISAFRAGSFGFNQDTLLALEANKIPFDSSYNASTFGLTSGVLPGLAVMDTVRLNGIYEYPMTVFNDGTRSLRHAQLTACSYEEMEGLLWQALESRRQSFVILSHNFELLDETKTRSDQVVLARFRKLCAFLERNRDCFETCGFNALEPELSSSQPAALVSSVWKTGRRVLEQACRKVYR